jgi:hypothetical protein
VTATPSYWRRSPSPGRAWSGWRPRSATSPAPSCRRSVSRSRPVRRDRARCPTSAIPSGPSRYRGSPACCAATRAPAWRTSRCGTSATSPTRRSSGSPCPTRRRCSITCSGGCSRSSRGWSSTLCACGRTCSSPTARSSPSGCCSRSSAQAPPATTPTVSSSGWLSPAGRPGGAPRPHRAARPARRRSRGRRSRPRRHLRLCAVRRPRARDRGPPGRDRRPLR